MAKLEEQSPEARERLASIETVSGFFNECQPRTEESERRYRAAMAAAKEELEPSSSDEYSIDDGSVYWGDE